MHGDVAEENVNQLRVLALQNLVNRAPLAAGNLPRLIANLPEPEPAQKMRHRSRHDVDLIERKFFRVLAFSRDDDGPDAAQAGQLPINVQHLGLEERRAIECDGGSWVRRLVQVRNQIRGGKSLTAGGRSNSPI